MAMTKEQIIREMIQIELLYQTRRHLKKLNESNNSTTNNQYNFSNNFNNTFIKDHFKNIGLTGDYKNADGTKKAINEIKYSEITKDDKDILWNELKNFFMINLNIKSEISAEIINILLTADSNKNNNTIFHLFEQIFPIQMKKCDNTNDLQTFAKYLISNKDAKIFEELFNLNKVAGSSTYGAGKGEFLCVLLIDGAKSGNSQFVDVVIEKGRSFEVKSSLGKSIQINYSQKSGLQPLKEKLIGKYSELGLKVFHLKEEFESLNVDKFFLNKINQNTISHFSATKPKKEKGEEDESAIIMYDLNEMFKQALNGLKSKTYDNISNFQNKIKTFQSTNNNIIEDINKVCFKQTGWQTGPRKTETLNKATGNNSTNKVELSSNVGQDVKDFFKIYNIKLDSYLNIANNDSIGDDDTIDDFNSQWKWDDNYASDPNLPDNELKRKWFKKLDINDYNKKLEINISNNNNNTTKNLYNKVIEYFKLKEDIPIIIDIPTWSNYSTNPTEFLKVVLPDFFSKLETAFGNDNYSQQYFNTIKDMVTKNVTDYSTNKIADNTWNLVKNYIYNMCNSRVVLTIDQMKKIKKVIDSNIEATQDLNSTNSPPTNTTNLTNDDYVIVEPIQPNQKGEYIVDISYYQNNKIKHIDTLHSQDLSAENKSTTTKNTGYNKKKSVEGNVAATDQNNAKLVTQQVGIDLYDVISDKEKINNKIKKYKFFNSLQPGAIEQLFGKRDNNKKVLAKITNSNSTPIDINGKELKDIINLDNASDPFVELIKKSDAKNSNNFLADYYSIYEAADQLEKQIEKFYVNDNSLLVFEETKDGYDSVFLYEDLIKYQKANKAGFVLNVNPKGISCTADFEHPDVTKRKQLAAVKNSKSYIWSPGNKTSFKSGINDLFLEVLEAMLEIQAAIRK